MVSRRAWGQQSSLSAEAFPPRDIRSLSSHSAAAAPGSASRESALMAPAGPGTLRAALSIWPGLACFSQAGLGTVLKRQALLPSAGPFWHGKRARYSCKLGPILSRAGPAPGGTGFVQALKKAGQAPCRLFRSRLRGKGARRRRLLSRLGAWRLGCVGDGAANSCSRSRSRCFCCRRHH